MKASEHARRHLAAMSPERRAQLEAEWVSAQGYPEMCQLDRNGECKMCGRCCDEDMRRDCMRRTISEDYSAELARGTVCLGHRLDCDWHIDQYARDCNCGGAT